MKKKYIIILIVLLVIIVSGIVIFIVINKDKSDNTKKYLEIKENIKNAVENSIHAMYLNCPIVDNFDKDAKMNGRSFNTSFLIENGYIDKEELYDANNDSYCDAYIVIKADYKDPYDHQNNCTTSYVVYLKCNDYQESGYKLRK